MNENSVSFEGQSSYVSQRLIIYGGEGHWNMTFGLCQQMGKKKLCHFCQMNRVPKLGRLMSQVNKFGLTCYLWDKNEI